MAEGNGVISATVTEFKLHPFWIIGGVLGLVVIIALASKGSGSAKAQNFSFSVGPTDAQLANQTALSIAQSDNATKAGIASNYFDYLTTAGNQAVTLAQVNGATANYATSDQDLTSVKLAQIQAGTTSQAIAAQTTQAQIAAGTTQHGQTLAAQTAQAATAANLALGKIQADTTYNVTALNTAAAVTQQSLATTQAIQVAGIQADATKFVTAQNDAVQYYANSLNNQIQNKQADYQNAQAAAYYSNQAGAQIIYDDLTANGYTNLNVPIPGMTWAH